MAKKPVSPKKTAKRKKAAKPKKRVALKAQLYVGQTRPVPKWPAGAHPDPSTTPGISCQVTLAQIGNQPYQPYLVRSYNPSGGSDGPLDFRIPNYDCYVRFDLDPKFKWEFDHTQPITLGRGKVTGERYHDLNTDPDAKGDHQSLRFHAKYLKQTSRTNTDPYNLNFLIYVMDANGKPLPVPLAVSVDPDIKNPGDPPVAPSA
jgi:hypothetical protein